MKMVRAFVKRLQCVITTLKKKFASLLRAVVHNPVFQVFIRIAPVALIVALLARLGVLLNVVVVISLGVAVLFGIGHAIYFMRTDPRVQHLNTLKSKDLAATGIIGLIIIVLAGVLSGLLWPVMYFYHALVKAGLAKEIDF